MSHATKRGWNSATAVTECPGDTIFTSFLKKNLARGPQKNNNKIKLQFSKPEFVWNNKMWEELGNQKQPLWTTARGCNQSQGTDSSSHLPMHRLTPSFTESYQCFYRAQGRNQTCPKRLHRTLLRALLLVHNKVLYTALLWLLCSSSPILSRWETTARCQVNLVRKHPKLEGEILPLKYTEKITRYSAWDSLKRIWWGRDLLLFRAVSFSTAQFQMTFPRSY